MERGIKKLWFVKREVVASTLQEAIKQQGKVYEVSLAEEKLWPTVTPKIGFTNGKEKE